MVPASVGRCSQPSGPKGTPASRFGVRKVDCNSEAVLSNAAALWEQAMGWEPDAMRGWLNATLARMPRRTFKKWWR